MAVGGGAGAASKPSFTKENSAVPTATEPSSPTKPDKAEVQRRVEEEKRRVAAAMEERRKASAQRKNTAPVAGAATGEGPKRVASPSKAAARLANGSKPAPPPSSTPSKVAPATTGSVAGETRVPSPPRVGHTTNPTPAAGTDPVNTSHDSSSRGKETSEDGTGSAGPSGSVEPASRANTKVSPVRRRQRPRSRNNRPTSMLTSQVLFDNGHGTMEQEQTQPQRRRISRCRNTPKTVMTNIPVDAHMPHMNYRSHGSLGGSSSQPAQSAPQRELKAALDESPPDRPLFGAGRASNGGYLSGSESGGTNSLTSPMRSGRGNGRQELGIVSPKPLSDIRPLPTLPGNSPQANSLPASRNPRRSPNDAAKVGLGFRRIGTGEATEERSLDADHLAATTLAPLPSLGRPQRPSVGV